MELSIEPDLYQPSINEQGNYVDRIMPSMFSKSKTGIYCPCSSQKDKTYDTRSKFSSHVKTKTHQKWLENLNSNKANFYIENEKLKETIANQRLIIGKMEKDLKTKLLTIDYLTQQLNDLNKKSHSSCVIVENLLDFD